MNKLTPDQEKGLRNLLGLIETTHALISNGLFPGIASQSVAKVLGWLTQYHKDVKYQLPVEPEKASEVKAETVAAVVSDPKVGE